MSLLSPGDHARSSDNSSADGRRVLILSASMGAGHNGAARELATRLEAGGDQVEIRDFLEAWPFGLGWFFRWFYEGQLKYAPWSYELLYRSWYVFPFLTNVLTFVETVCARPTVTKWIRKFRPDVVVSTYPISSLVIGKMRQKGRLHIPTITYITDFHIHPLVTHDGVDLHLTVHKASTDEAARHINGPVRTIGPLVSDKFRTAHDRRDEVREMLGAADKRIVMVAAGSWGAGDVEATARDVAAFGNYLPVIICGRNENLVKRLDAIDGVVPLGWTEDMPGLMAAADVLIDNAGGLSSMEALRAGLPVINYRPLAGHGRDNATDMQNAGVVRIARTPSELGEALGALTDDDFAREIQIANGFEMFGVDAADEVTAVVDRSKRPVRFGKVTPIVRRYTTKTKKSAVGSVAAVGFMSIALTTGVGAATAHGIASDRPHSNDNHTYVGIRLSSVELADPKTRALVAQLHATAVIDSATAIADPSDLKALVASGVEIANGGCGVKDTGWRPWGRASKDIHKAGDAVSDAAGVQVKMFLPGRRLDGFDMLYSKRAHETTLPTAKTLDADDDTQALSDPGVYVLDGRKQDAASFQLRLTAAEQIFQGLGTQATPLSALL